MGRTKEGQFRCRKAMLYLGVILGSMHRQANRQDLLVTMKNEKHDEVHLEYV